MRLAHPAAREMLVGAAALARVAAAAYDASRLAMGPPYEARFDEVRIGQMLPASARGELRWARDDGQDRRVGGFEVHGLGGEADLAVDFTWLGAVVARVAPGGGRVAAVDVAWPRVAEIDQRVAERLGALPSGAEERERARREALLGLMRAEAGASEAVDEASLGRLLARAGVASVGALVASRGQAAALRVRWEADDTGAEPGPVALPIAAAGLVRDPAAAGFSLRELLATSAKVRARMGALGIERPVDERLPRRHGALVLWVVPRAWFDDPHWPGGEEASDDEARRQARIEAASAWLSAEGIVIVDVP